jgi:hypothetical protein
MCDKELKEAGPEAMQQECPTRSTDPPHGEYCGEIPVGQPAEASPPETAQAPPEEDNGE